MSCYSKQTFVDISSDREPFLQTWSYNKKLGLLAEPNSRPRPLISQRLFTTPLYPPVSTFTLLLTIVWTLFYIPKDSTYPSKSLLRGFRGNLGGGGRQAGRGPETTLQKIKERA